MGGLLFKLELRSAALHSLSRRNRSVHWNLGNLRRPNCRTNTELLSNLRVDATVDVLIVLEEGANVLAPLSDSFT